MLLECAHDENVDEMERLLGDFINGIALYEQHVLVAELHVRKVTNADVLKKAAGTLISGVCGSFRLESFAKGRTD